MYMCTGHLKIKPTKHTTNLTNLSKKTVPWLFFEIHFVFQTDAFILSENSFTYDIRLFPMKKQKWNPCGTLR